MSMTGSFELGTAPADRTGRDPAVELPTVTEAIHQPEKLNRRGRRHGGDDGQKLLELLTNANVAQVQKSTQLIELLRGQALNSVLESGTERLNSSGVGGRRYAVPFASVYIVNTTGAELIVTAAHAGLAPTAGPGVLALPPGFVGSVPLTGNMVSFTGAPGAKFVYAVLTRPVDPNGSYVRTSRPVAVAAGQLVTGPGAVDGLAVYETTGAAVASLLLFDSLGAPAAGAPIVPVTLQPNESARDELPRPRFTAGLWAAVTGSVGGSVHIAGSL